MQHLDTERLAALTDEPASNEELAHLAACAVCRTERDAFAALAGLATRAAGGAFEVDASRLTEWASLSAKLRAEGLITGEAVTAEYPVPATVRSISGGARVEPSVAAVANGATRAASRTEQRPRMWSLLPAPYLQIAATITLVLGGLAFGRVSAGAPVFPVDRNQTTVNSSGIIGSLSNSGFSSIDDAQSALTRAQSDYERAAVWLANHDTSVTPAMYRKRLAVLDQIVAATREAMHELPQDPIVRYQYQATSSARETTLRQLGEALPVNKTIERF